MSFFEELKRRNVVRVGIAYVVIGWVLAQVAELAFDSFGAPDWVMKSVLVLLLLGLPLALFFAWVFEMTPEGIKLERNVDRSQSVTTQTGRTLDFIIIGVLGIAVSILLIDEFLFDRSSAPEEIVATDRRSIAVLPFANMSDDSDHFADGLSEELLNLLAKNPDLRVIGRTSSFAFKGRNEDLREIGDALGVEHVLEGSFRRSGDQLRITAQLIDVSDASHLWSETYDRPMADIFAIQDDVAGSIASELELRLLPDAERSTDNTQAYAFYVETLPYIANNTHPDMLAIVIGLLDQALAIDPNFAKAHEAKALTYWISTIERIDSEEGRLRIIESASRAVELDESLTLARYMRDIARLSPWTWNDEFLITEAALAVEPDNFDILRTWCFDLIVAGYLEDAVGCTDQMIRLEPLSPVSQWRSGLANRGAGQRDVAHQRFTQSVTVGGGSSFAWALVLEAIIAGDLEPAANFAANAPDEYGWQPEDIRRVAVWLEEDNSAGILAWIEHMAADADSLYARTSMYYWYLALGYMDEFWAVIQQMLDDADGGWDNTGFLLEYGSAFWESGYRRHPGYLQIAEETELLAVWERRGPPDFCSKDSGEWRCN